MTLLVFQRQLKIHLLDVDIDKCQKIDLITYHIKYIIKMENPDFKKMNHYNSVSRKSFRKEKKGI